MERIFKTKVFPFCIQKFQISKSEVSLQPSSHFLHFQALSQSLSLVTKVNYTQMIDTILL